MLAWLEAPPTIAQDPVIGSHQNPLIVNFLVDHGLDHGR